MQLYYNTNNVGKSSKFYVPPSTFRLLHNYLLSILSTNNYESEHLPEKIMQYIGMIVES